MEARSTVCRVRSSNRDESRILTWSGEATPSGTARLWDVPGDLDYPAKMLRLEVEAITGTKYDENGRRSKSSGGGLEETARHVEDPRPRALSGLQVPPPQRIPPVLPR